MAFDVIVFNQNELNNALNAGIKRIALCDNSFSVPDTQGIEYTLIGKAEILGASPVKHERTDVSSYASSYKSSYMSSYAYSYVTSYVSSYVSSYISSFMYAGGMSFAAGSYGSYGYSFGGSFSGSYVMAEDIIEFGSSGIIFVNGYGINLI